ncbi:hypothetical protein BX666DRAFT_1879158 [Dichotomocladium elegans]|nr:hypothetical protein BX666DRAFT_1879158 [Dichotomocladium elegans]
MAGEKQPALEDLIKLASYPSNDDDLRQFTSFTLRSSSPVSKVILMHMYASRHEYVKALSTIRLLRKNNDLGDMATAACDKLEISIKEKQPAILTYLPEDIFLSKPGNASRDYEGFFPSHGLAAGPLLFGKAFNSIIRGEKLKMTGEDSLRQAL